MVNAACITACKASVASLSRPCLTRRFAPQRAATQHKKIATSRRFSLAPARSFWVVGSPGHHGIRISRPQNSLAPLRFTSPTLRGTRIILSQSASERKKATKRPFPMLRSSTLQREALVKQGRGREATEALQAVICAALTMLHPLADLFTRGMVSGPELE